MAESPRDAGGAGLRGAPEGGKPEAPTSGRRNDTDRLGTAGIGRLLVEFSIPSIIAMVCGSLYNIVDTMFLQIAVPEVGAAVTQLAFPVQTVLMGFSMLAGIGGNALAAIELGRGHKDQVEKILGNTASLLVLLGVATAIAGTVFIGQLLALLGTTDELWEPTRTFVQIVCVGFILQSLGMGMNNFLRTAGKPNFALGTSALGTGACAALNALLVLGAGWGVAGSALATVLGQGVGMVPVMWYFMFSKKAPFHLHARNLVLDARLALRIMALGLASFVMQAANSVVTVVLNYVITKYAAADPIGPTAALATISIVWKVLGLCYTMIIGVTAGAQPILGFNVGAREWPRVLRAFKLACLGSAGIATACWLFFEIAPQVALIPFSVSDELLPFACLTMRVFAIWLPFVGYQMMGSSYFQSSGQPLKSTILELTRQVLFLIPLYLLFPPFAMSVFGVSGLVGVILCVPLSDVLAFITTTVFVVLEVRRLKRLAATEGYARAAE